MLLYTNMANSLGLPLWTLPINSYFRETSCPAHLIFAPDPRRPCRGRIAIFLFFFDPSFNVLCALFTNRPSFFAPFGSLVCPYIRCFCRSLPLQFLDITFCRFINRTLPFGPIRPSFFPNFVFCCSRFFNLL